jgi:poly(A) polymerase
MTIQENALKIVKTLKNAGYTAYFAGGWVRDFIMRHPSDDIDIATDAPPEVVISLFPRTILVGVAFGVVIVVMNGHQFEVATFRKDLEYISGRRPEKIEHSNAQEDALRRDFTINGMFYDPLTDKILDYVNGQEDIQKGIIRTIGSAHERFSEDRLRMVRAIRFASRFGFKIHEETQQAIQSHANTLFPAVAMERIWQEFSKMSKSPRFDQAIIDMHRLGLLPIIFPALQDVDENEIAKRVAAFNQFPKGSPAILYLMELFPNTPLDQLLELCQYLKISGHEGKLIEFAYKGKLLLTKEEIDPHHIEGIEWTKFYADRFFQTCFEFITASYPHEKRSELLEKHSERRERLLPHIQRMMEKKPLVTALILQDYGILPGKEMGYLLKEAEKLAIKHDMHDPAAVVALLKSKHLWPEGK